MGHHFPKTINAAMLASALAVFAGASAGRAAFDAADFLKTDGPVIRADSGRGSIVTLRGTNIGGWLVHEGWMSPNGYGAVDRSGWSAAGQEAVLDGRLDTDWTAVGAGDRVELDLGTLTAFDRIVLSTGTKALPDGEWLFGVSRDGVAWQVAGSRQIAVKGDEVVADLDNVYTARHVRVGRRGESSSPWSVAEVNLHQNDDFTVRMALKRRFGGAEADALFDEHQSYWFDQGDLDNIQAWGMNVLRVPMNWLEFVEPDGTWKEGAWKQLDWVIDECNRRRIYVILDMHAVPGGASPWASSGRAGDDGTGQNPNGFWTNPEYLDITERIWTAIAARYRGNPAVAGYDFVNEPLYRFHEMPRNGEAHSEAALRKAEMHDRLYRAVRAVDPDHIIFIAAYTVAPPDNTAYIGTPSGFFGITPPSHHGWTNVVYQTHHYDMPNARDWHAQNRLVETALADIAKHQREWNVPVLAGEYSLYRFYDIWAKWMSGLNALNVSWTNWTYKVRGTAREPGGADWGFFNDNRNDVPDINRDQAAEIVDKWSRFSTRHFSRNDGLIDIVRRHTGGGGLAPAAPVPRVGWRMSASSDSENAMAAIDGDPHSEWSTGDRQDGGEWIQADLGQSRRFDRVVLETASGRKADFPHDYQVLVSADGGEWKTVASGHGFGNRMVVFVPGQSGRFVRIVQLGQRSPGGWSVANFELLADEEVDGER